MDSKQVYGHLFEPEDTPIFTKRAVAATTRGDLEHRLHFTSARMFVPNAQTFRLEPYQDYIDWFTKVHDLGDVLWPVYNFTDARDVKEFIDEVKRRNLYLFDIWGYVPGSYSNFASCGEVDFKPELADYMHQTLGARFLGFDNGEQDGRYVGGYAPMMCPVYQGRKAQYDNFQHYFEFMHGHLRNHVAALCSLNYGHYFIKENDVSIVGSECAQALQNVNLWYAYLRGAGKQYGVLWFGNVSICNRWGRKEYDAQVAVSDCGEQLGPAHGASLSLLRRILYTHYTYNCDILGFEGGYTLLEKDQNGLPMLSPVGRLSQDGHAFAKEHGYPGPMHTPVAIYMGFHNGWVPPRHLYTRNIYRVWGNEPYDEGDYQTHALFSLIYPQYEESGYYRDETGFLTPTPHGDLFDVLFSDARAEVLSTYNRVILSGGMDLTLEDMSKLRDFVENGGSLNIFAGQVAHAYELLGSYEPELLQWFGLEVLGGRVLQKAGGSVLYRRQAYPCEGDFELYEAKLSTDAAVTAAFCGKPAAYDVQRGAGTITVILVPWGMNAASAVALDTAPHGQMSANEENTPICVPFRFTPFVGSLLGDCFDSEKLADVSNPGLQYSVNLRSNGGMLLTVVNNSPRAEAFDIRLVAGKPFTTVEIPVPGVDHNQTGYYPPGFTGQPGSDERGQYTIDPMDIRMFELAPGAVLYSPKPKIELPDRTALSYLTLSPTSTVRSQINQYTTADTHFAGLKIDGRYLLEHNAKALMSEGDFVKRRGFDVIVDFSALFNYYPDWTIADVVMERYAKTLREFEDCLDKAQLFGCRKIVIIMSRWQRRVIYDDDKMNASVERTLFHMIDACKKRSMVLYLQSGTPSRFLPRFKDIVDLTKNKQMRSLRLVLNVSHAIQCGEDVNEITGEYADFVSGILISAPEQDSFGQFTDRHAPVYDSAYADEVKKWIDLLLARCKPDFVALDACFKDWNEVWSDLQFIQQG